jgi:RNA polymerase sigma-70 factor (ECF subfamily)
LTLYEACIILPTKDILDRAEEGAGNHRRKESMVQALTMHQQERDACIQLFEDLVRRYQPLLYKKAYEVLQNHHDAEDAVQETLLKAYECLLSYTEERRRALKAQAWLCEIVQNTARNMCRDKKRHESLDTAEESEHLEIVDARFEPPEVALMREETWEAVHQLISTLPSMIRFLVRFHYVLEYRYEALAHFLSERLGWEEVATGVLRTRISRGLALLRNTLREAEINISDLDAWSEWSTVFDEPTELDDMLSVEWYAHSYLDLHLCSPRSSRSGDLTEFLERRLPPRYSRFDQLACTVASQWVFRSRSKMMNGGEVHWRTPSVESTLVPVRELLPALQASEAPSHGAIASTLPAASLSRADQQQV